MILGDGDILTAGDFELSRRNGEVASTSLNLEDNERRLVQEALSRHTGNVSRAAEALGITRAALYRRMQKFEL